MIKTLFNQLNIILNKLNKSGNNTGSTIIRSKLAKLKNRKLFKFRNPNNNKVLKKSKFLTFKTKKVFHYLKQVFTKTPIF